MTGKLIIVRHGESEWNATGQWTGLTDVNLTPKGRHEAELMGEQLRDIRIDHAFTSEQIRTVQTLEGVLKGAQQPDVPYDRRWGINERDYGEYTGMNKWQVKEEVGEEKAQQARVRRVRRRRARVPRGPPGAPQLRRSSPLARVPQLALRMTRRGPVAE